MKRLIILVLAFLIYIPSFSQIDLSHLEDKNKTEQKKTTVNQSTQTAKEQTKDQKKEDKTQKTKANTKNKKPVKKPVKKTDKKYKYVFKKEEQNFYKFDDKGNPIVKQPVKKSTTTQQKVSGDLIIGLENKTVSVNKKEK